MNVHEAPRFNGSDYVRQRDDPRLTGQVLRVFNCMRDAQWRTLEQIAQATGDPPASISAQLRHLRKERFGAHTVEKDYVGEGLFRYRLVVRPLEINQQLQLSYTVNEITDGVRVTVER